jgi:hypothetical protein
MKTTNARPRRRAPRRSKSPLPWLKKTAKRAEVQAGRAVLPKSDRED